MEFQSQTRALCLLFLMLHVNCLRLPHEEVKLLSQENTVSLENMLTLNVTEGAVVFDPKDLELGYLWGKLGDSVLQLTDCLAYAEQNGITTVRVSDKGFEKVRYFLEIPLENGVRTINVHAPPPDSEASCSVHRVSHGRFVDTMFKCDLVEFDRMRILKEYIRPLVVPQALTDTNTPKYKDDAFFTAKRIEKLDELVIHIRSGDAWAQSHFNGHQLFEYRMPPCAYYDKIIESGTGTKPFDAIRIVTDETENNQQHPCIKEIQKRHPETRVLVRYGQTRQKDAAALMNARYLVTAPSHFSYLMAQLNQKLEHVWVAEEGSWGKGNLVPCGRRGQPVITTLHIPGLEVIRTPVEVKAAWMVDYKDRITEKTCKEDEDLKIG